MSRHGLSHNAPLTVVSEVHNKQQQQQQQSSTVKNESAAGAEPLWYSSWRTWWQRLHHNYNHHQPGQSASPVPSQGIRQIIVDPPIQHARTAAVYADYSESRDRCVALSRKDATLLAQLTSRHSMHLKAYKHLLDASVDPNCLNVVRRHTLLNTDLTVLVRCKLGWKYSAPRSHFRCQS